MNHKAGERDITFVGGSTETAVEEKGGGSNVVLAAWTLERAEELAEAVNNPKITANLRDGIPSPYTVADARDFIESVLSLPQDSQYMWAIVVNGTAIGSIGFTRKENIHRFTAELGYYLAEPYWGKGIMTSAIKKACARVFDTTDILRIFAEPFARNAASCRVLEKAGFSCEGTLRSNAVKSGEVIDMKMYALIRK